MHSESGTELGLDTPPPPQEQNNVLLPLKSGITSTTSTPRVMQHHRLPPLSTHTKICPSFALYDVPCDPSSSFAPLPLLLPSPSLLLLRLRKRSEVDLDSREKSFMSSLVRVFSPSSEPVRKVERVCWVGNKRDAIASYGRSSLMIKQEQHFARAGRSGSRYKSKRLKPHSMPHP